MHRRANFSGRKHKSDGNASGVIERKGTEEVSLRVRGEAGAKRNFGSNRDHGHRLAVRLRNT